MLRTTYTALDGLKFGVVDDNPYFRRLVRTMLNGFGVREIFEGATPDAGWELLLRGRPDVLLVDWYLGSGIGTGLTLLDRIRTHADDMIATQTVVLLSAHSDRRHVLSAVRLGANDFVVKPVSARMLYERIRRIVHAPRTYVRREGRAVLLPASGPTGADRTAVVRTVPTRAPAAPPARAPAAPPPRPQPKAPAPQDDDILFI